jgi:nitroimidazol reductase NimA-like FMN-containing flavoprotein (pyridoxamine 5'-phosphate oxidase superfamily)
MSEFPITERNRTRRMPKRGQYDKDTVYRILDEGLVCHVGLVENDQPVVIPMNFARRDDTLILHGAPASRLLKYVQAGHPVCVTVTLLDGLVLARSVYHHSMNYRSAVVFGRGRLIETEQEKLAALEVLTEHIVPGRWQDARRPNRQELDATAVVSITIDSASAKVRTGPPADDEDDYQLPVWAGVLPIQQQALTPVNDPRLRKDIPVPSSVSNYRRTR